MSEERDTVVFYDEDDNEIEMDVLDYFIHNGQEYAILMDISNLAKEEHDSEHEHGEDCECDECAPSELYIMKVVVNGEEEEFLPVDEDMLEELAQIAQERLFELDDDDDEDDEEEEDKAED